MGVEMKSRLAEASENYEAGKFEQAAEGFRAVLETNSRNALARQGLAQCLNRLRQYEEATEECNRALELEPELAIPYAVLGSIYHRQRCFEKSEAASRRAIELDSSLLDPYVCLGATLMEQQRLEEAISVLHKALELSPNDSIARYNLSITYTRQKRHAEAVREALRAFRLGPSTRTGKLLVTSILIRLEEHRALFSLFVLVLLLIPFLFPTLATLPIFLLIMVRLAFGIRTHLQSRQPTRAVQLLVLVLTLTGLYTYHLLYGL